MDLMFRDQSKEVASKAQGIKAKAKPKGASSANNAAPDWDQVCRRSIDSDLSAACDSLRFGRSILEAPAEQQAVCFFFSNYVLDPSKVSKSVYDYVPAVYNKESEKSALSCAVAALGLAGLSYRRSEPGLFDAAKSMYSAALHLTNEALRHRATAATDPTLITVLLLGLYETNTCNAPPAMRAWLNHIKGAAALLELRGKQQLETELGRRLFTHLRTQIVNVCILRRTPIPTAIIELSHAYYAMDEGAQNNPPAKMTAINVQLCDLRAKIGHRPSSSSAMSPQTIISEALSIVADLNDWHSELPPDHFPTSTVQIYSPRPDVCLDYCHMYRDLSTATIMNNGRVLLILVHEIILTQVSRLQCRAPAELDRPSSGHRASSPGYQAEIDHQIETSQSTILGLIDLICATVPFLLDYDHCASATLEPAHPRAAGGNAVMWPLYVAAQISFVPTSTRAWIIARLSKIGNDMGVQQATIMAKFLLQRMEITDVLAEENDTGDLLKG